MFWAEFPSSYRLGPAMPVPPAPFTVATGGCGYLLEPHRAGERGDDIILLSLNRLGRDPTADIPVRHESCSRTHAAIVFEKSSRRPYLVDCGSANGTFLNKLRLEKHVWTPLRHGDSFRCGESTQYFVLVAPPDYRDEVPAEKSVDADVIIMHGDAAFEQVTSARGNGAGAGAGSGGTDTSRSRAGTASGSDWFAVLDLTALNEKERALHASALGAARKLSNVLLEAQRIKAKEETGELSAGQSAALARCESAAEALSEASRAARAALRSRCEARRPGVTGVHNEGSSSAAGEGGAAGYRELDSSKYRDVHEDVADRTHVMIRQSGGSAKFAIKKSSGAAPLAAPPPPAAAPVSAAAAPRPSASNVPSAAGPVETEASLRAKIRAISVRRAELHAVDSATSAGADAGAPVDADADDSLEIFLTMTAKSESAASLIRTRAQLDELDAQEAELLRFLALIAPTSQLADAKSSMSAKVDNAPLQLAVGVKRTQGRLEDDDMSMPPPPPPQPRVSATISAPLSPSESAGTVVGGPVHPATASAAPSGSTADTFQRATRPRDAPAPKRPRLGPEGPPQYDSDNIVDVSHF